MMSNEARLHMMSNEGEARLHMMSNEVKLGCI